MTPKKLKDKEYKEQKITEGEKTSLSKSLWIPD